MTACGARGAPIREGGRGDLKKKKRSTDGVGREKKKKKRSLRGVDDADPTGNRNSQQ